uniref:Uncharacterized protein n=1 Tax=Avena sativa TaxID=4498 RepID=A0ACD5VQ31_AVESA
MLRDRDQRPQADDPSGRGGEALRPASPAHSARLHARLLVSGRLWNPVFLRQLVSLYAATDRLDAALRAFRAHHLSPANLRTYVVLISRLARPQPALAFSLFSRELLSSSRRALRPNPHVISAVLAACAGLPLVHGRQVHACASKIASLADVFVYTGLVHAYATGGDISSSTRVFDEMPLRNVASWNALLVGYTRSGMYLVALRVFRELASVRHNVQLDQVTMSSALSACAGARAENFGRQVHACIVKVGLDMSALCVTNALLEMYTKCDCSQQALALFDAADCRDVFTWNIVILGCIHENRVEKACRMFRSMVRGAVLPDDVSFATVLQATACLAAWALGASLHACVVKAGFVGSQVVARSLVSMYSKSGRLDDARRVFEVAEGHLSIMSWTAMITAFQQHGQGGQAINLFETLLKKGIMPDHITFVSVLSSCSHSGLVELGRKYFSLMTKVYKLTPRSEHYCCMVDMFGRAGHLGEAKQFIDEMPVKPDASVLGALLAACLNCGDLELGKEVAENLFEIEPGKAGNYVLLANIYALHGRLEEAKEVRRWMVSQEVRKEKGCSLVNMENGTVPNASGLSIRQGKVKIT